VPLTLAHADASIQRLGEILFDYLLPGPLELGNVPDGDLCHVTVTRVAPLPAAVPRYAADVLTQPQAAVEHTLYAEVEAQLGRDLTAEEGRSVQMPALSAPEDFDKWLRDRKRPQLPPMRAGSELVNHMRALQPYQRRDSDNHPLRLLAEHTNLAKHRTPAVANILLGQVNTWPLNDPDIVVAVATDRPLEAGTVLATGPLYKQMPVDIWPKVATRRPHTGDWMVVMDELGRLEEWVRTVAVPVLITGDADAAPLPPQIDTTRGWDSVRDAIETGHPVPAAQRNLTRMQARTGRRDLTETLDLHPNRVEVEVVEQWVNGLPDEEVIAQIGSLESANRRGPRAVSDACLNMIRLAESTFRQAHRRPDHPAS